MTQRHKARRMLRRSMRTGGNWRLKGLLLAALDTSPVSEEDVGREWPTDPREKARHLRQAHSNRRQSFERHLEDGGDVANWWEPEISPVQQTYSPSFAGETRELSAARSHFDEDDLETGVDKDKYLKRMLLNESHTELDVLWREELSDTVIQGARPRQIARDASAVTNVNTRKGDLPRGSAQQYAPKVAEGAEIPRDEENFDTVPFDCEKRALGFEVSDTLIDHAVVDMIERQIAWTGAAVENGINREWLVELIDNVDSANNHDTSQTAAAVSDVNKATEFVEMDDFPAPDTLVMHPEFKTDLFDDTNLVYANRAGSDDVLQDRSFNQLLGMQLFTASDGTYNNAENASNTWGFNNGGEYGAIAYNSELVSTVIYRDIETKDYDDPIRDIKGGNARAYIDAVWHQPSAGATITY